MKRDTKEALGFIITIAIGLIILYLAFGGSK